MPKVTTMLGTYDTTTPAQADAASNTGKIVWPGGLALIAYLGLRLSGFRGSVLWLGPIAGAVAGWKMQKLASASLRESAQETV